MSQQTVLETVLRSLPAGYLLIDDKEQILFVSPRFQIGYHGELPAVGHQLQRDRLPAEIILRLTQHTPQSLTLLANGQLLEWLITRLPEERCLISVREDRQAFRTLVDNSPDIITRYDCELRCCYVNNTLTRFAPSTPAEHIGRLLHERKLPSQLTDAIRHNARHVLDSQQPQRFISEISTADGNRVFESRLLPEFDEAGNIQSLLCIDRDISEHHAIRQWEAEENRLLEMIANDRPLPEIMTWTCLMVENQLSGALCSIMQLSDNGQQLHTAAAPSLADDYKAAIDGIHIGEGVGSCGTAAMRGSTVIVSDITTDPLWADFVSLAEQYRLRACWSQPILAQDGKVLGTFAIYHHQPYTPDQHALDITRRTSHLMAIAIQQEQRASALYRLATRDGLTGLANRRHFLEQAAQQFQHACDKNQPLSLLMLDLDHFKQLNDCYGHEGGDTALQAFAQCLKHNLRPGDTVGRMGGEEFAAILPDTTLDDAHALAQQLALTVAALVIPHHAQTITLTVSIGVTTRCDSCHDLSELIRRADKALYQAKAAGRNRVSYT